MVPNVVKLLYPEPYGEPIKAHYETDEHGVKELMVDEAPRTTEIAPKDLFLDGVSATINLHTADGDIVYQVKEYDAEREVYRCKLFGDYR